jgi:hypothetical protein
LLLFAIGSWNPRAIKTQKRLAGYTANDFELLSNFLNQFASIATTAHILTEVSNLAGAASGQMKEATFLQLESLFVILDERQRSAISLCAVPEFRIFGITDAAIILPRFRDAPPDRRRKTCTSSTTEGHECLGFEASARAS